jgi:hypothetical protein
MMRYLERMTFLAPTNTLRIRVVALEYRNAHYQPSEEDLTHFTQAPPKALSTSVIRPGAASPSKFNIPIPS